MNEGESTKPRAWTFTLVTPPVQTASPDMIWRCGKHVVLYLAGGGQMPPVCLWTGTEVGPELRNVEFVLEKPNAWRWRFPPLRFGYQRAFRTLVIPVPASSKWLQQLIDKKARLGKLILSMSVLCCVPLLGLLPFVLPFEDGKVVPFSLPFILVLVGCVTCLAFAIVGACWTKLRGAPGPGSVRAKLTEESYVWISGAHPQVLKRLPEWPGSPLKHFDFRVSYLIGIANFFINVAIGIVIGAPALLALMAYMILR